jgi:DNA-binding transcriptional MerR regulator
MLIGELSKLSGLSRDTIRFYEKEGLIKTGKRQVNNYRDYSGEILQKLLLIKKLKGLGFTLDESGTLIAMLEEDMASCQLVGEQVVIKVKTIDQKIAELNEIKTRLLQGVNDCRQGASCDLLAL